MIPLALLEEYLSPNILTIYAFYWPIVLKQFY